MNELLNGQPADGADAELDVLGGAALTANDEEHGERAVGGALRTRPHPVPVLVANVHPGFVELSGGRQVEVVVSVSRVSCGCLGRRVFTVLEQGQGICLPVDQAGGGRLFAVRTPLESTNFVTQDQVIRLLAVTRWHDPGVDTALAWPDFAGGWRGELLLCVHRVVPALVVIPKHPANQVLQ
ncbi:MAG: hypothetical protein [Podoviridae sp. ctdb7]|nr:MAG: hypothetical protein [Podoviridae sp. ctdb7]